MKKKTTRRKSTTKFVRKWHKPKKGKRKKTYISDEKLREILVKQLGKRLDRDFGLFIADEKYYCTPLGDAKETIKASALDRQTWVEERFDCDDFAHVLKAHFAEAAYKDGKRRAAHCFGILWKAKPEPHAINWMINSDKKLRFIEPQDDSVFAPRKKDKEIFFMLV